MGADTPSDRLAVLILALGGLAFVLFVVLVTGAAPVGPDTIAYKDAAANLAQGKGFVTSYNFGNATGEPRLYAGHPPAYALLAGLWYRLFGFSVESNAWFESLLRVGFVVLLWWHLAPVLRGAAALWRWLLLAVLLLGLPSALASLPYDRPDVLSMAMVLLALAPLRWQATLRRAALASLFAGLSLLVAPIAALLAVLGIAIQWLLAAQPKPGLPAMAVLGLAGLVLPAAAIGLLFELQEPGYLARLGGFIFDGGGEVEGGSTQGLSFMLLLFRDPGLLLGRVLEGFTTLNAWVTAAALLAVLAVVTVAIWRRRRLLGSARGAALLLLAWGLVFLCLFPLGWEKGYPALFALFLPLLFVDFLPAREGRGPPWVVVALAVLVALNLPFTLHRLVTAPTMADSLSRMRAWIAQHPLPDANGDGGVVVALDNFAFYLFKEAGYRIVGLHQPTISGDELARMADAYALSFNGTSDPALAKYPYGWSEQGLERVFRPDLPQLPMVFGLPLARSSKTWEVEVWQRVP